MSLFLPTHWLGCGVWGAEGGGVGRQGREKEREGRRLLSKGEERKGGEEGGREGKRLRMTGGRDARALEHPSMGNGGLISRPLRVLSCEGQQGSTRSTIRGTDALYASTLPVSLERPLDVNRAVWEHYCGATLIAPRFVLTAARCVPDAAGVVAGGGHVAVLGGHNVTLEGRVVGPSVLCSEQRVAIVGVNVHPASARSVGLVVVVVMVVGGYAASYGRVCDARMACVS
eukprot:3932591-Rhodomonas_salina.1